DLLLRYTARLSGGLELLHARKQLAMQTRRIRVRRRYLQLRDKGEQDVGGAKQGIDAGNATLQLDAGDRACGKRGVGIGTARGRLVRALTRTRSKCVANQSAVVLSHRGKTGIFRGSLLHVFAAGPLR